MKDNIHLNSTPENGGFAIAHLTNKSITDFIRKAPADWLELDLKTGGAPIRGHHIELPVLGEEYVTTMNGYWFELATISFVTNYLYHRSNTRVFRKKGDINYYFCSDAPLFEIGNALSCAPPHTNKVFQRMGYGRINDFR